MMRRHQILAGRIESGFTLLETLVVLVVTSLISVVLLQGLGTVLNLRNSFGDKMVDLDRALVKRSMVTTPIQGLIADFDDGAFKFSGNSTRIIGLTLQPLTRRPGRATPFAMEIVYSEAESRNSLLYQEQSDQPITLLQWEGARATFRYIGDDRGWLDQWPNDEPQIGPGNIITEIRPPQLPELIYLQTNSLSELDFSAAVMGRRNRLPRDPPMLGG